MNKEALLGWILQEAEKNGHEYALKVGAEDSPDEVFNEYLRTLTGKVQIDFPVFAFGFRKGHTFTVRGKGLRDKLLRLRTH